MTLPLSKRLSTWTNLVGIVSGAFLVYAPDIVPAQYLPHTLLAFTIINGIAQAIKQGKLDNVDEN